MTRGILHDENGGEWEPFKNGWQQRKLRNVKTCEIKDDPRWNISRGGGISTEDKPRVRIADGAGSDFWRDWGV